MDDLVQFLRDRLDEDEQAAHAAADELGADWHYDGRFVAARREDDMVATGSQNFLERERGEHIARHDPAHVLREVEAKRKIVDASAARCPVGCRVEHSFSGSCMLRSLGPAWEADGGRWVHGENGEPIRPPHTTEWTLRLLALPYSDHPDYRSEWAS